jgi:hypothetical protein
VAHEAATGNTRPVTAGSELCAAHLMPEGTREKAVRRQAPACRAPRARLRRVDRPRSVTELGFLVYRAGLRGAQRSKGHETFEGQCGVGRLSGSSGSVSAVDPCEPGAPDDCDISTNPIVLVSRVTTGRPRNTALRLRRWNDDPYPLPFMTTIPVFFERPEGRAGAGQRQPVACAMRVGKEA